MSEFTFQGLIRWGWGFYNPNHAAAAICALLPFLLGWRKCTWIGCTLSFALCVALALTYSRTGLAVLAFEAAWWWMCRRERMEESGRVMPQNHSWQRWTVWILWLVVVVAMLVFIGPRFSLDDSVLNRPRIWLAGLRLCAANPFGVGFGRSGEIVSALLPDGITVRTLVNSHLTLLSEQGVLVGGTWLAFVLLALMGGGRGAPPAFCPVGTNVVRVIFLDVTRLFGKRQRRRRECFGVRTLWSCCLAL